MALVIRNGRVVTEHAILDQDVVCEGGRVAALGAYATTPNDTILDARGRYVLPGGIETHTHLDLEVMGLHTADDFYSGSRAALYGGSTTFLDFATQFHGETLAQGKANWDKKAAVGVFVDYGYHMALTEWNDALSAEMAALTDEDGITSYKLYMAYKGGLMVDDADLFLALRRAHDLGVTIGVHCENGDVIDELVKEAKRCGHTAPAYHEATRPPEIEAEAINRFITLATLAGASHYVVHLSTASGLDVIRHQRAMGAKTIVETCPQYLYLDKRLYREGSFDDQAKVIMSPPLRTTHDQEALWDALANGDIQFVGTDHCSFNVHGQKDLGREGFWRIPNGAPGIELRLPLLYSGGVATGRFDVRRFVDLVATNAARHFGLYPRKGTIAVGADADLVVFDPDRRWVVRHDALHDAVDYTPYEGLSLTGCVTDVVLGGRHLIQEGRLVDETPHGRYLTRTRPKALRFGCESLPPDRATTDAR